MYKQDVTEAPRRTTHDEENFENNSALV